MASAFFRSRWAAVIFLVAGIALYVGWSTVSCFIPGCSCGWARSLSTATSASRACARPGGKGVGDDMAHDPQLLSPRLYGFLVTTRRRGGRADAV